MSNETAGNRTNGAHLTIIYALIGTLISLLSGAFYLLRDADRDLSVAIEVMRVKQEERSLRLQRVEDEAEAAKALAIKNDALLGSLDKSVIEMHADHKRIEDAIISKKR